MFLGNRRIAWDALKVLSSDSYRESFDVRAIVSDEAIRNAYEALQPESNACFISSDKRQTDEICETITHQSIDVLLSIQYNWVLPGHALDLVGRRAFNLHNARLPDYKGYNSITHAIANRDGIYETTIHWMADNVDSGDIAYVAKTPIRADDTAQSLYLRTVDAAMVVVHSLLQDLASGAEVPRQPMSQTQSNFYRRSSVDSLADVSSVVNAGHLAPIARATFFPPKNTAHFFFAGQKFLIIPESAAEHYLASAKSANQPHFESKQPGR